MQGGNHTFSLKETSQSTKISTQSLETLNQAVVGILPVSLSELIYLGILIQLYEVN